MGAGHDAELGELGAHLGDELCDFGLICECDDEEAGVLDACGVEEIEPGGIAVEDLEAEFAQHVHVIGIAFEHGDFDALGHHEAADEIAEASETGEDHWSIFIDAVGGALVLAHCGIAWRDDALVDDEEEGRDGHGQGDHSHQEPRNFGFEDLLLDGHRQQSKGELAALGEREREQPAMAAANFKERGDHKHDHDFESDQSDYECRDEKGLAGDDAEIERGTDGEEEEAEEEAFEGLEVALKLMTVMTAREDDACDEGTESG